MDTHSEFVIIGTKDPTYENINLQCMDQGIDTFRILGGDHSLEVIGDLEATIENMKGIIGYIQTILNSVH